MSEEAEIRAREDVIGLVMPSEIIHWIDIVGEKTRVVDEKTRYCEDLLRLIPNIDYITESFSKRQPLPKPVYSKVARNIWSIWFTVLKYVEDVVGELIKELWSSALKFSHVKGKGYEAVIVDTIVNGVPSKSVHVAYPDASTCRKAEWLLAMRIPWHRY